MVSVTALKTSKVVVSQFNHVYWYVCMYVCMYGCIGGESLTQRRAETIAGVSGGRECEDNCKQARQTE